MPGTPILTEQVGYVKDIDRQFDILCLINLEFLCDTQVERSVETVYATVALSYFTETFTDILLVLSSTSGLSSIDWIPSRRY